jgi:hypothetical protein
MALRIALTVAYAVALGAVAFVEAKGPDLDAEGVYDFVDSVAFGLAFLGATLAVGFVVRSTRVLLALIGPVLSLGYLQVTGYTLGWRDGIDPLLSAPAIVQLVGLALVLVLASGLGAFCSERWPALRRRLAAARDG